MTGRSEDEAGHVVAAYNFGGLGRLGAGFYRSNGGELVAIDLALAMVVVTGDALGFNGLPLLGSVVDLARVPLAGALGPLPGRAAARGGGELGPAPRHPIGNRPA